MLRLRVLLLILLLLMAPSLGSANPNGVGEGTFDAQCGGACHGDADMNKSSPAVVQVVAPSVAYEGLLTSVSVDISNIETTQNGLLGVFLLSDLSGASDTPADDGWSVVSNSEGGIHNYVEVLVSPDTTQTTVTWTLRAPPVGTYPLHAAVHHGTEDGSEAPFFGASAAPAFVEVREVPEDLPRLAASFEPPTQRDIGETTTVALTTEFVTELTVEWRLQGGETQAATVTTEGENAWSFELPASLQPAVVEWRVHLAGEGPEQTSPWFQLRSDHPSWTVDETTAYVQSVAMLLVCMVAFMALQHRQRGQSEVDESMKTEDGGEI
jgi:hypothetical protein